MYELLVLSLLKKFPLHAYLIYKIANDTIGPWESLSRGTLSTLLNKLFKKDYIEEAAPEEVPFPSDRASKTYKITAGGETRFHEIMMDTTKQLSHYQRIFHIKALYLSELAEDDQLYLVNHYIDYCAQAIQHIHEQKAEFDEMPEGTSETDSTYLSSILRIMDVELEHWDTEVTWACEVKDQIIEKES
ncbi:PadR family transcriptional regulator [Halobacillus rhizosphaerae]|uniref:PadR family transcriptional regulator n=1 Tax=Halobacillus rhizosphaerae TaxID=3064889 RepID=UPI00398BA3B3